MWYIIGLVLAVKVVKYAFKLAFLAIRAVFIGLFYFFAWIYRTIRTALASRKVRKRSLRYTECHEVRNL